MTNEYIKPNKEREFFYLDAIIDRYFNIETLKCLNDTRNSDIDYYNYLPTSYFFLEELFTKYKFESNDCFVDIGCGKGRALVMAMLFGAKKVCGIEINKKICDEAIINVERILKIQQLKDVKCEIINKSITDVEIQEDWNKFFMFKPFNNEISQEIIKKIYIAKNKKEKNSYIYLYHPSKDVVEWIERNNMFNLVEKDIQVIEKEEKYIKRKIRSCVYCNNDVSVSNHIWRY